MILWLLAYLGGLLTILSPCILPVLPFVFSSAEQPFRKSGLPLLAGMAVTFAGVSTLAVVGGGWVIHANEWGRWLALVLLSLFAISLLSPALSELISRPFTRFGGTLHQNQQEERGVRGSFLLGVATGFLWAPCAGPVLGLILTSAALRGASANTSVLLLAYALGAATSLAAALLVGGKLLRGMRAYLGVDAWVRKILGVAVLVGVAAIAFGWDRGTLTQLSRVRTEGIEQKLIGLLHPAEAPGMNSAAASPDGMLSALRGAGGWINSPPLTPESLRGKVVLIDFWTYSCINCLRTLPYVKAWSDKYKASGLVVIGVHTPEFAFEKNPANVEKAVRELGITYPVALDSAYAVWNGFSNQYWPAHYFIDGRGKVRDHHFGEGNYAESERILQQLLAETHAKNIPSGFVQPGANGTQAPSQAEVVASPETYVGYARSENQVAIPALQRDQEATYTLPGALALNQWSLVGRWTVKSEQATLGHLPGKIVYRFHARDLHLVLGPGASHAPVHFMVRLDGAAPKDTHGTDIDASGRGIVREQRLYQLIRQKDSGAVSDHTFEIEFLDPGVQAFAFTFG